MLRSVIWRCARKLVVIVPIALHGARDWAITDGMRTLA
jgi:hypothetical protein